MSFKGSIRGQVTLLLSFIFMVVIAVASIRAYERMQSDIQSAYSLLSLRSTAIAEKQGESVRYAKQIVNIITITGDLKAISKPETCPMQVRGYLKKDPAIANIIITDLQGNVVCSTAKLSRNYNLSDRAYFHKALKQEDFVSGDPVMGKLLNRSVLPFAQRYSDVTGKPSGVIVVSLDLDWVNKEFKRLLGDPGIRTGLVTSEGLVLSRYPEPEKWVGRNISHFPAFKAMMKINGSGTTDVVSHDGQKRIYSFANFSKADSVNIYLWMTLPRDSVVANAIKQFEWAIAIALSLLVLTLGIAWYLSERAVIRPLYQVIDTARRLSLGDHDVRTGIQHNQGEIGQLAAAFDEMAYNLSRYDSFSGLPNQLFFEELLEDLIVKSTQREGRFSILSVSIDNLLDLDATYPIEVVDGLIKTVSARLTVSVGANGLIGKLGRGAFHLATPDVSDPIEMAGFVTKLKLAVGQPYITQGLEFFPSIHVGVAFFPDDGSTVADLIQHSSTALNQARLDKHNAYRFFEPQMNQQMLEKVRLLNDMRHAIEAGDQFMLFYQPQKCLLTGKILGVESLLRWNHPNHGMIPPGKFILLAEESGLIVPLGDWVMVQSISQAKVWITEGLVTANFVISINVSPVQFESVTLIERIKEVLNEHGLDPKHVELELTESLLMENIEKAMKLLQEAKTLGLGLAIDDFGTGYSSLAYLRHFDVDKLKIDKSFIDHITTDPDSHAIVSATVNMAHALGMTVIAEGVETAEQMKVLATLGCDEIQGYFCSKPIPAEALIAFMEDRMKESK
jgi:diguanylate cyclase (GGDEF)-like protein